MNVIYKGFDDRAMAIASALRHLGAGKAREKTYKDNDAMVEAMRKAISDYDPDLRNHPVFVALEEVDRAEFMEGLGENPYRFRSFQVMPDKGFVVPSPHMLPGHFIPLDLKEGDRCLEIETGSGYTAAVIHHMVGFNGLVESYEPDTDINKYAKSVFKKITELEMVPPNVKLIDKNGFIYAANSGPFDKIYIRLFPTTEGQAQGVLSRLNEDGIALMYQARPADGLPVGPLDVLEEDKWVRLKREDRELYRGGTLLVTRKGDDLVYRIARETGAVQPAKPL